MEAFVERMIAEHSDLLIKINKLEKFIYSEKSDKLPKADFSNMCIQLKAMRIYAEALGARLFNQNIVIKDGQYFEHVGGIVEIPTPEKGSDFDIDAEDNTEVNSKKAND